MKVQNIHHSIWMRRNSPNHTRSPRRIVSGLWLVAFSSWLDRPLNQICSFWTKFVWCFGFKIWITWCDWPSPKWTKTSATCAPLSLLLGEKESYASTSLMCTCATLFQSMNRSALPIYTAPLSFVIFTLKTQKRNSTVFHTFLMSSLKGNLKSIS